MLIKHVFVLVILLEGVLGNHLTIASQSPATPAATKTELQITAQLLEDTVGLRGRLRFNITFKNLSDHPIVIYKNLSFGDFYGLQLLISDAEGNIMPPRVWGEPLFRGSDLERLKPEEFVTVKPGETLTIKRSSGVADFFIKSPGKYTALISYMNPVPSRLAPSGVSVFGKPGQLFTAEPVTFTVQEQKQ